VNAMPNTEEVFLLFAISGQKGIVAARVVPCADVAEAAAVARGMLRLRPEAEFVEIQLGGKLVRTVRRTDPA